jgi:hypothetical protein
MAKIVVVERKTEREIYREKKRYTKRDRKRWLMSKGRQREREKVVQNEGL